jgi:hypothetical protein
MVRVMSNLTNQGHFACTCPVCGAALAVTSARPDQAAARSFDIAQDTVLEHLFAVHEPVVEHASVMALGALTVTGANSLQVSTAASR